MERERWHEGQTGLVSSIPRPLPLCTQQLCYLTISVLELVQTQQTDCVVAVSLPLLPFLSTAAVLCWRGAREGARPSPSWQCMHKLMDSHQGLKYLLPNSNLGCETWKILRFYNSMETLLLHSEVSSLIQ